MDSKAVYQSLRQELLDSYNKQINLITLTFTATTLIIGYGFTAKSPMIFLLPIIIHWLSLIQLNNTMYSVFTISIYIRRTIESTNDIPKWERDISALRDYLRHNQPFEELKDFNPIISFDAYHYARAIIVMGIACIILCLGYAIYWYLGQHLILQSEAIVSVLASIISAGALAIYGRKLFRPISFISTGKFEERLSEEWDKIQPTRAMPIKKESSMTEKPYRAKRGTMTTDSNANVIREMIRHEDDLLIGRTNWLMTLQGLFFTALAFGWTIEWLPLIIIIFGALFAALFIPYLTLSEKAIIKLLTWWKENNSDYEGAPVIGLEYKDVPTWYSRVWPWSWSPIVFIAAWIAVFIVWLWK